MVCYDDENFAIPFLLLREVAEMECDPLHEWLFLPLDKDAKGVGMGKMVDEFEEGYFDFELAPASPDFVEEHRL